MLTLSGERDGTENHSSTISPASVAEPRLVLHGAEVAEQRRVDGVVRRQRPQHHGRLLRPQPQQAVAPQRRDERGPRARALAALHLRGDRPQRRGRVRAVAANGGHPGVQREVADRRPGPSPSGRRSAAFSTPIWRPGWSCSAFHAPMARCSAATSAFVPPPAGSASSGRGSEAAVSVNSLEADAGDRPAARPPRAPPAA